MAAKAERAETEAKVAMVNKAQLHRPAIHGTMVTNAIENQGKAEMEEEVGVREFAGRGGPGGNGGVIKVFSRKTSIFACSSRLELCS